jgi:hypothetical protein
MSEGRMSEGRVSVPEGVRADIRRPAIPPGQFALLMGIGFAGWAGVGALVWMIFT